MTLLCGADESPLQLGSIGARIAQMYLMDVLFSELCRRNLDQCRQSRARIADALAEKLFLFSLISPGQPAAAGGYVY